MQKKISKLLVPALSLLTLPMAAWALDEASDEPAPNPGGVVLECGSVGDWKPAGGNVGTSSGLLSERLAGNQALGHASTDRCGSCLEGVPPCAQANFWKFPGSQPDVLTHQNPDGTWTAFVAIPDGSQVTTNCAKCQ